MADEQTASQRFEEEARLWEESGRLQSAGQREYAFLQLHCWLFSDGAKVDEVSKRLKRYYAAAKTALRKRFGRNWMDNFLSIRDNCSRCGQSFSMENLSLCTHCYISLGYCHSTVGEKGPNGNYRCPSCKVGEIVG